MSNTTPTPSTRKALQDARAAKAAENKAYAQHAFMVEVNAIRTYAENIIRHADNHLDYDADEITWAHHGTAAHITAKLKEILAFIEGTEE